MNSCCTVNDRDPDRRLVPEYFSDDCDYDEDNDEYIDFLIEKGREEYRSAWYEYISDFD